MDGHIGVIEVVFAIKDEMFVEIKQLRHCVVGEDSLNSLT